MQRFRLMNIYLACVLLVLIMAIFGVSWLRPSQADATGPDAGPLPDGVNATQQVFGHGVAQPDAAQLLITAGIRNSME
jgi:hypothetical protein